jgi:hypothetical protein
MHKLYWNLKSFACLGQCGGQGLELVFLEEFQDYLWNFCAMRGVAMVVRNVIIWLS